MGDAIGSTGEAKGEIKGGDDGATVSSRITCGTVFAIAEKLIFVVIVFSFFNGDTTADPGEDGEIIPKANSDSVTEGSSVAVGIIIADTGRVMTGINVDGVAITAATEGGGGIGGAATKSGVGVKTEIIDDEAFAKKRESFSSIAASIADADA